jgi:hypothetical protein
MSETETPEYLLTHLSITKKEALKNVQKWRKAYQGKGEMEFWDDEVSLDYIVAALNYSEEKLIAQKNNEELEKFKLAALILDADK